MHHKNMIPRLKMGKHIFPMLMLGSLPFIGISYKSFKHDEIYRNRFSNIRNIIEILSAAIEYGINVLGIMPDIENPLFHNLLNAIKKVEANYGIEIGLGICIPVPLEIDGKPIDTYRRWLTYYYNEKKLVDKKDLFKRYLDDPVLQWRKGWKKQFLKAFEHLKPYVKEDFNKLSINLRSVGRILNIFDGYKVVFIEPGSEIDFLVVSGRLDLLDSLLSFLQSLYEGLIILGSHHSGITIPVLEKVKLSFNGFMTPINMLGVMMFPSKELSLKAVEEAKRPVIAIKVLAGGRLKPLEAIEFALKYVKFLMVGVASTKELNILVRALFDVFPK